MANVTIRDLPDDVHETLRRRADEAGQSLQRYLAGELSELARNPTVAEFLDRAERRGPSGQLGSVRVEHYLREDRESR